MTTHLCIYFILVKGCNIFPKEYTFRVSFPHAANVQREVGFFLNKVLKTTFIFLFVYLFKRRMRSLYLSLLLCFFESE